MPSQTEQPEALNYEVRNHGGQYCVYSASGRKVRCHATKQAAHAHMARLIGGFPVEVEDEPAAQEEPNDVEAGGAGVSSDVGGASAGDAGGAAMGIEEFDWTIQERGGQHCVVKKGDTNPVPGGCHASRADAIKHMRALYANVPTAAEGEAMTTITTGTENTGTTADGGPDLTLTPPEGINWITDGTGKVVGLHFEKATEDFAATPVASKWEGVLGLEASPTSDKRVLMRDEIGMRDPPLPLMVQLETTDGHDNSRNAGSIDSVTHIPIEDFARAEEFNLENARPGSVVIWAEGTLDGSEWADEAQRMMQNGCGVSLDITNDRIAPLDPDTLDEVDLATAAENFMTVDYLKGIAGKIAGATVVPIGAFEEASIKIADDKVLVASAYGVKLAGQVLTAAAGPVKPPASWFSDPHFKELTPLQILKTGEVLGHLCDWDGCHIGFQGVCVPPFKSYSNYAYFNTGEIETAEGDLVPVGKIMFSRSGAGHASTDPNLTYQEVQSYYDDATKVGAFVRAGSDRFGTWLHGALRSDLTDLEIQHLRTHPPSGDWRPIKGITDLIAAFAVPVGGFPIRRALVASADGEISAIITAPLQISDATHYRRRRRKATMLKDRLRIALGVADEEETMATRAEMRKQAMEKQAQEFCAIELMDNEGTLLFKDYTAEQRRQMAKDGRALPDGSYPIDNCTDAENAIHAQGRTGGSQGRVVAHIRKRVAALGCSGTIFDNYK
jgi:hypothetical protein